MPLPHIPARAGRTNGREGGLEGQDFDVWVVFGEDAQIVWVVGCDDSPAHSYRGCNDDGINGMR